jgi:hypothetical protein
LFERERIRVDKTELLFRVDNDAFVLRISFAKKLFRLFKREFTVRVANGAFVL